jgi:hypothetical protein
MTGPKHVKRLSLPGRRAELLPAVLKGPQYPAASESLQREFAAKPALLLAKMATQLPVPKAKEATHVGLADHVDLTSQLALLDENLRQPDSDRGDVAGNSRVHLRPDREELAQSCDVARFFGVIGLTHELLTSRALLRVGRVVGMNQARQRAIEAPDGDVVRHRAASLREPPVATLGLAMTPLGPPGGLVGSGAVDLLVELFVRDRAPAERESIQPRLEASDLGRHPVDVFAKGPEALIDFALEPRLLLLLFVEQIAKLVKGIEATVKLHRERGAFEFIYPGGKH